MLWHLNSFYALMLFLSLSPQSIICERIEKRAIDLNEVADFVDVVENESEIASTDSVENSLKKVNDIDIDLPDGLKTILPVHVRNVSNKFHPNKNLRRQIFNPIIPPNSNTNLNINNDYKGDHLQHLINFKMRQYKPKMQLRKKRSRQKRYLNISPIYSGESKSYLGNLASATNDAFLRMQNYAATLMVLVTTQNPNQKKEARLSWPKYTEFSKSNQKKPIDGSLLFKRKPLNEYQGKSYTKSFISQKSEKKYRRVPSGSTKKPSSTKHPLQEVKKDPESFTHDKTNESKRQGDDVESYRKKVADKNINQYATPPGNIKDLLRVISTKKASTKHDNEEISSSTAMKNTETHTTPQSSTLTTRQDRSTVTHVSSEESPKTATDATHTQSTVLSSTLNFVPKKNPYAWENDILKGSKIKIKKHVPMEISNLPEEAQLMEQSCSSPPITKHVEKSEEQKKSQQPTLETVETENMISQGFHDTDDKQKNELDPQRKVTQSIIPPAVATAGYQFDEQQNMSTEIPPGIRQAEETHPKTEQTGEETHPKAEPGAAENHHKVESDAEETHHKTESAAEENHHKTESAAEENQHKTEPAAEETHPKTEASASEQSTPGSSPAGENSSVPSEPSSGSSLSPSTIAETTKGSSQTAENPGTTSVNKVCEKVMQNNAVYNLSPDCDTVKEDGKDDGSGGIDIPSKEEVEEMERLKQKARSTKGCGEHTTTDGCTTTDSCTTTSDSCTTTPAPCNSKKNQDSCDNNDDDDNENVCDEGTGQAPNVAPPCSDEDSKKKVQKVKPKFRLRRQVSIITPALPSTTPHYTLVKLPNINLPMLAQPQQTQLPQINPVHVNQIRAIDTSVVTNNILQMGSTIPTSTMQGVSAVKKSVDKNIIESVVENLKIVDQKLAEAVDPLHSAQEALDNASKCDTTCTTGCPGENVLADISDSERNALQKLAYKIINSPKVKRSDVKASKVKNGNIVKRGLVGDSKKEKLFFKKNEKLEKKDLGVHSDYYDIGDLNQEISRLERDLTIADELQGILDDIKKDTVENKEGGRSKRTAAYLNPGIVEEREDNFEEGQKPSKVSHKHVKNKQHKHVESKQHTLKKKEMDDEEEMFGRRKKKKKKKFGGRKNIWMRLFGKRDETKGFLDKNLQNSQFAEN